MCCCYYVHASAAAVQNSSRKARLHLHPPDFLMQSNSMVYDIEWERENTLELLLLYVRETADYIGRTGPFLANGFSNEACHKIMMRVSAFILWSIHTSYSQLAFKLRLLACFTLKGPICPCWLPAFCMKCCSHSTLMLQHTLYPRRTRGPIGAPAVFPGLFSCSYRLFENYFFLRHTILLVVLLSIKKKWRKGRVFLYLLLLFIR